MTSSRLIAGWSPVSTMKISSGCSSCSTRLATTVASIGRPFVRTPTCTVGATGCVGSMWGSILEQGVQARPNGAQRLLRLRADADLVQHVVDHFAERVRLDLVQKQRALRAPLDYRVRMKPLDRGGFAMRELDPHGAVVRVDLDHSRRSVLPEDQRTRRQARQQSRSKTRSSRRRLNSRPM